MKKVITSSRSIAVSPNYIDSNILKNIFYLLKKKYEKTCDENDGMILSIDNILKVSNIVSRDSCYVNFDITFTATVIKPEKDMILTITPSYLMASKGIFSKIFDNINIFVPELNMKEWKFSNDTYTNNKGKVIDKNSVIDVIVKDIKFNSTKYNCVCALSQ